MRTVGTARLVEGQWHIETEPHVLLRMKRVFERIQKAQHGTVKLSDTPENARELAWFFERYPFEVSPRDYLDRRAEEHLQRQLLIEQFFDEGYTPPKFDLALPPREYQRSAADLALRAGGLLLADDLGLGKTVSAIAMLSDPRALPALVVTLTHLPRQWEAELARFAPSLRVHILRKGTPYDLRNVRGMKGRFPDVVICNYHKLSGWADTLAGVVKSVTFDEVQELRRALDGSRNPTRRYAAAKHIADAADFRLGLSATPVYNYGGEMFNILDVLNPDVLGTREEFTREWCRGNMVSVHDPRALGTYLRSRGAMLRRTRAEVGRELPPLSRIVHTIESDTRALDEVGERVAELASILLAQGGSERGAKLRASEEISYLLRQATGIGKAPFVADFVRLLVESGEKVVLYGWHRAVYDIWADKLRDLKPAFYTGSESPSQKEEAKRRFIEGETPVIILSLRAGAGLDGLQRVARTVVFGELDWSPGVHDQGIGRVFRDEQTEPVTGFFLVSDAGSDPVVADVLGLKRQQAEAIRDPDADLLEELQVDPNRVRRLAETYLRSKGLAPSTLPLEVA